MSLSTRSTNGSRSSPVPIRTDGGQTPVKSSGSTRASCGSASASAFGAITTHNENLDAIIDEVGGFLPFVAAGAAARAVRPATEFRPLKAGEVGAVLERERARAPVTAEEVRPAQPVEAPPTPQPKLTLQDLGVDLERIRREDAALRAKETVERAPEAPRRAAEPQVRPHPSSSHRLNP